MKKGLCRSNILALCFIVTVAEVNFFFFFMIYLSIRVCKENKHINFKQKVYGLSIFTCYIKSFTLMTVGLFFFLFFCLFVFLNLPLFLLSPHCY